MPKFGEKRDVSLRLPQPGQFSAVSRADLVSDAGVRAARAARGKMALEG